MFESTIADFDAHRPTHLQVDCGRICANYQQLKAHANGAKVMAILKANAYGHGLLEVAQALESQGADYFGVAYVEEGVLLRKTGVETAKTDVETAKTGVETWLSQQLLKSGVIRTDQQLLRSSVRTVCPNSVST